MLRKNFKTHNVYNREEAYFKICRSGWTDLKLKTWVEIQIFIHLLIAKSVALLKF